MLNPVILRMLWNGLLDTLYMTLVSTFFSYIIGLPLGITMVITSKNGLRPMPFMHRIFGILINVVRSVPFLILLIAVLPFTRWMVGTTIGSTATIVPLVIASAPFVARLVESSIQEVDRGVIEAAQSMGASNFTIIRKVLLVESFPSLMVGASIAITTILSYSAMAGIVGGGGLGDIAIRYGYYRYQNDIMMITVILLVVIVQILQELGMKTAKIGDKRNH